MQPYVSQSSQTYTTPSPKWKAGEDEAKRKRKKRMKWLGGFLLLFLIWAVSTWLDQQTILEAKKVELEAIQAKANQANEEQMELLYQVKRLHDMDYIAEIARKDYFLSKPGEVIFRVPENEE